VHSIERLKIAERLGEQRPRHMPALQVCLQVNVSGEASKSGVAFSEVSRLAHAVAAVPGLRLRGLMSIPEPGSGSAPHCALRELLQQLQREGLALDTLSMGMSGDLEEAIAEGATVVRVGTAVFGKR
ncbi:MAG: YggS family pyridoxal phosphate-dependent enzyme, partial [Rhizobacter sp.]